MSDVDAATTFDAGEFMMTSAHLSSNLTSPLSASKIDLLKSKAKKLRKEQGLTHMEALDQVAKAQGFKNWRVLATQSNTESSPSGELFAKVLSFEDGVFNVVFDTPRPPSPDDAFLKDMAYACLPFEINISDLTTEPFGGTARLPYGIAREMSPAPERELSQLVYKACADWLVRHEFDLFTKKASECGKFLAEACNLTYEKLILDDLPLPRLFKSQHNLTWKNCWVTLDKEPAQDSHGNTFFKGVYCSVRTHGEDPEARTWRLTPLGTSNFMSSRFAPFCSIEGDYSGKSFDTREEAQALVHELIESLVDETMELASEGMLRDLEGITVISEEDFAKLSTEKQEELVRENLAESIFVTDAWGRVI